MSEFWIQTWAQFLGGLLSSLIVVPIALWLEARLDESREKRHERREADRRKRER